MNPPPLALPSPLRVVLVGLVLAASCLPVGLWADESPASDKAPASSKIPASDNVLPEPIWYWLKSVDIPAGNPLRSKTWDSNSPPDILVTVERNGVKMEETDSKEGWTCVFEKKFQNVFGFRQHASQTYTITIFDHDTPDPNDQMMELTVNGDAFDKEEVVVREKSTFASKESLVSVTFVRITKEERISLQKAAGK